MTSFTGYWLTRGGPHCLARWPSSSFSRWHWVARSTGARRLNLHNQSLRDGWQAYRRHEAKNWMTFLPLYARDGARLEDLRPLIEDAEDHAKIERIKQHCSVTVASARRQHASFKRPPLLDGQTRWMPARTALKKRRSMVARKEDIPTVSDRRSTGLNEGLGGRSIPDGSPDPEGRGDVGLSLVASDPDPSAGPCLRGGRM
jgi:hypothetical protein